MYYKRPSIMIQSSRYLLIKLTEDLLPVEALKKCQQLYSRKHTAGQAYIVIDIHKHLHTRLLFRFVNVALGSTASETCNQRNKPNQYG